MPYEHEIGSACQQALVNFSKYTNLDLITNYGFLTIRRLDRMCVCEDSFVKLCLFRESFPVFHI